MNILIKNVDIITSNDAEKFIKNGYIGIKDGYFEFVGSKLEDTLNFVPDKIIDGKYKLAMPGLINAHTHCAMTILRNFANDLSLEDWLFKKVFPAESRITPEDIYWGTQLGIAEMIKSGTTAFADMYLEMDSVARAVVETGIRANLSKSPMRFNVGENLEMVNQTEDCFSYYKNWDGKANNRIKVSIEVHSAYLYDEESLRTAVGLAKQLNTSIQIHILETLWEREETLRRYGMDSIDMCQKIGMFDVPVIAAHCVHLTDRNIEVLKQMNVNVVHNPTSNLKLGSGIARVPDMLRNGINLALGTDGAASNNNLNMFEEMHLASLIHKGVNMNPELVSAEQTIKMATVNGAKAIGFGSETGCIRKGMKADMILLDTDKPHLHPLTDPSAAIVYSAQGSDVDTTIIDGEIIMEGRKLKTIDEELVKNKVDEISKRILK